MAFNTAIQTKPFLYKNSLNYYHLKIGLTRAGLIRFQFRFLEMLAVTELFTQPMLAAGVVIRRVGGFHIAQNISNQNMTQSPVICARAEVTCLDLNVFTDIFISENSFI